MDQVSCTAWVLSKMSTQSTWNFRLSLPTLKQGKLKDNPAMEELPPGVILNYCFSSLSQIIKDHWKPFFFFYLNETHSGCNFLEWFRLLSCLWKYCHSYLCLQTPLIFMMVLFNIGFKRIWRLKRIFLLPQGSKPCKWWDTTSLKKCLK